MNADLMPSGHLTSRQRYKKVENPTIGSTIQGTLVTIVKNMDIFLRIALEHISKATTTYGWVRLHVLAVWRLVISIETIQQDHQHQVMEII